MSETIRYDVVENTSTPQSVRLAVEDEKTQEIVFDNLGSSQGSTQYVFSVQFSDEKEAEVAAWATIKSNRDSKVLTYVWGHYHWDVTWEEYNLLPPERTEDGSDFVYFVTDLAELDMEYIDALPDNELDGTIEEAILIIKEARDYLEEHQVVDPYRLLLDSTCTIYENYGDESSSSYWRQVNASSLREYLEDFVPFYPQNTITAGRRTAIFYGNIELPIGFGFVPAVEGTQTHIRQNIYFGDGQLILGQVNTIPTINDRNQLIFIARNTDTYELGHYQGGTNGTKFIKNATPIPSDLITTSEKTGHVVIQGHAFFFDALKESFDSEFEGSNSITITNGSQS